MAGLLLRLPRYLAAAGVQAHCVMRTAPLATTFQSSWHPLLASGDLSRSLPCLPNHQEPRRWLSVSSASWDKHEKQKEAFLRMLKESKEALMKLDAHIQGMLPPKEDVKEALQTLGDQLATKMESTSREYEQKAQKLSGGAKKTVMLASKNLRDSASRLRTEYPSVNKGVMTLQGAMHTAVSEAQKISEALRPHTDAAARSVKRAAHRSLEQATTMSRKLNSTIRK